MGSKRKQVAPEGAATETAAVEAVAAPVANSDAVNLEEDIAPGEGQVVDAPKENDAISEAPGEDRSDPEIPAVVDVAAWPKLYRVTNCTRMPLHLPAAELRVAPFGGEDEVLIKSQDHINGIQAELAALQKLNGFAQDAFILEPVGE